MGRCLSRVWISHLPMCDFSWQEIVTGERSRLLNRATWGVRRPRTDPQLVTFQLSRLPAGLADILTGKMDTLNTVIPFLRKEHILHWNITRAVSRPHTTILLRNLLSQAPTVHIPTPFTFPLSKLSSGPSPVEQWRRLKETSGLSNARESHFLLTLDCVDEKKNTTTLPGGST